MNFKIRSLLALSLLTSTIFSRIVDPSYQIATWWGFRTAAVSYTFDDNCSNQLALAVPLFDEYKMKLTLFTVSGWVTDWQGLKAAALQGHEIASHTVTHTILNTLSAANQESELKNSQTAINANIPNLQCITMAYPNCIEATESLTAKYYVAARGCSGIVETATPANAMNISCIVGGNSGTYTTVQSLNDVANQALAKKGWGVLLFHGIDNDGGYSPVQSSVLRAHIKHLDSLSTTVWVSTFGTVFRYGKERDSISVREVANDGAGIRVQISDNLPNAVYNVPVTLKRNVPNGWTAAFATQNGKKIPCSIVAQAIQFDAVPDAGDIVISQNSTSVLRDRAFSRDAMPQVVWAGHAGNCMVVSFRAPSSDEYDVRIVDVRGTCLFKGERVVSGTIRIPLSAAHTNGSIFFVRIAGKQNTVTKQIIMN